MIQKFKSFLASYSITAHSVVVAFFAAELLFNSVPQFHDLVMSVYAHFSPSTKQVIVTILAVYAWYRNNKAKWDGINDRRQQ